MRDEVPVPANSAKVARGDAILTVRGLGSCACVALYYPPRNLGGVCHILWCGVNGDNAARLIGDAIGRMVALGADRHALTARITGGASLFRSDNGTARTIGLRNIEVARTCLRAAGVRVVGEDVGGTAARSVMFSCSDGRLLVRRLHGEVKEI